MRSGAITVILAVAALGVLASAPLALAQGTTPQSNSDPTGNDAPNLPPLMLNSPDDFTVTHEGLTYTYRLGTSHFLVVDDGDTAAVVRCTINGVEEEIHDNYNAAGGGGYGPVWELLGGVYPALCKATDAEGLFSSAEHTVTINAITTLFTNPDHESKLKRIASLVRNGVISVDDYHKVVKYFHKAGILDFDIVRNGSNSDSDVMGGYCYRDSGSHHREAVSVWVNEWYGYTNVEYKQCLESIAEQGVFDRIDLGF